VGIIQELSRARHERWCKVCRDKFFFETSTLENNISYLVRKSFGGSDFAEDNHEHDEGSIRHQV